VAGFRDAGALIVEVLEAVPGAGWSCVAVSLYAVLLKRWMLRAVVGSRYRWLVYWWLVL